MEKQSDYQEKNLIDLRNRLIITPPSDLKNKNSIIEFERFKRVEINWEKVFEKDKEIMAILSTNRMVGLKPYFNSFWSDINDKTLINNLDNYCLVLSISYSSKDEKNEKIFKDAENILCIKQNISDDRYFAFFDRQGIPLDTNTLKVDLATETIKSLWEKVLAESYSIQIVSKKNDNKVELEKSFKPSEIIPIDKSYLFYKEEFDRLDGQLGVYKKIIAHLDSKEGTTPSILENHIKSLLESFDLENLDILTENYASLKNMIFQIGEKIDILVEKVRKKGYFLAKADNPDNMFGNEKRPVYKGEVYNISKRVATFTIWETRSRPRYIHPFSSFLGPGPGIFVGNDYFQVPVLKSETQNFYEKIEFEDPIEAKLNKIKAANPNINIYEVQLTKEGYMTQDRVLLRTILTNCELDEIFRMNCVVVIPKYDFILTNKQYKLGATIFCYPLPGIINARFPEINIREELAYRLSWEAVELGQLAGSINLAPGESRNITLNSSFTQSITKTTAFKSLSDISTSSSEDLATEFQNEASKEMSKTDSLSASVSGSYGGLVSGSASGSTTTSLRTFTREMSKIAKRTASSINKRFSTEINSSSTTATNIEQNSNRVTTITNINQGRSLNLLIYQLNNRFTSGLFLEDLSFVVKNSKELIGYTDLYDPKTYTLNSMDSLLEQVIEHFIEILGIELVNKNTQIITKTVMDAITTSFLPYTIKAENEQLFNNYNLYKLDQTSQSIDVITPKDYVSLMDTVKIISTDTGHRISTSTSFNDLFTGYIENQLIDDSVEVLILPSGGFYIDSNVGVNPATEGYSEIMRTLEAEKVKAGIEKQKSENELIRSKIHSMNTGLIHITDIINFQSNQDELADGIIGFSLLALSGSTKNKAFKVYLNGKPIENTIVTLLNNNIQVKITWRTTAPSLEELKEGLLLVNEDQTIQYV